MRPPCSPHHHHASHCKHPRSSHWFPLLLFNIGRERLSALGPGTVTRSGAKGSPVVAPGAVHVDEDDDDDIDDKASVRANAGTVGMSRQTSLNSLSNLYPSRQATADDGDGGGRV